MQIDHSTLESRRAEIESDLHPSLALRIHRALSWLGRAERENDDDDARFIFLWIAFNAAYANELPDGRRVSEQKMLAQFLRRLLVSDQERRLYQILWSEFPGAIRVLIDNPYVFGPFWACQRGEIMPRNGAPSSSAARRRRTAACRSIGFPCHPPGMLFGFHFQRWVPAVQGLRPPFPR